MFSLCLRHGGWQLTDGLKFCSCPWGTYSLNVKRKSILYTRGVSNDCRLVALKIKSIVAMERHFKEETRWREQRMYDMQRMNGNEQR